MAMTDVDKLNILNNEIKLLDYRINRICSVGIEHFTDLKVSEVPIKTDTRKEKN
jgi:hypothetical protein